MTAKTLLYVLMNELSAFSKPFWQNPYILLGGVVDLVVLDQISKYAVRNWMEAPITLVPEWLTITFVENHGVAFSLPVPGGVSGVIAVVVSLWLGYQLVTQRLAATTRLAYVLIMAGAIGNLIDRVWHGAVTDFISVSTFPVFNAADSFICVGVALMLWHEITSG